jgi:predicted enzyme related to lactoylglutathione lyase
LQLCFSVKDLDAFLAKAKNMGVAHLAPPQSFDHTTFVTILDPDSRHARDGALVE